MAMKSSYTTPRDTIRPLSRKPFPAPKNELAAQAFFRRHHVPKSEWPRLLPDLMAGYLYEYDIEPWMDLA